MTGHCHNWGAIGSQEDVASASQDLPTCYRKRHALLKQLQLGCSSHDGMSEFFKSFEKVNGLSKNIFPSD
jgi:hypothetical protein